MDADTLRYFGDGPARIEDEANGLILVFLGEVTACRHAISSAAFSGSLRPSVYKIGNGPIDDLESDEKAERLAWLAGDLAPAILAFIDACGPGDSLLGCFYEFRHLPTAQALKAAADRGVTLRLIVDGKDNASTDEHGVFHESFPREANRRTIAAAELPTDSIIERTARMSDIAHNKFMIRLTGNPATPTEVWTGSTNLSDGGISGQTNVGHWIRDIELAEAYRKYWELLSTDPGGLATDTRTEKTRKNKAFELAVAELSPVPDRLAGIAAGVTAVFSPRPDAAVLQSYADLLDRARAHGCVTLAFGISPVFKTALQDNTADSPITFLLLEKPDQPRKNATSAFVRLNAANNVYEASGSFLADPVYQWARETNTQKLGLNQHVFYIHSKFMLVDPLGADPIVVSGSANFSQASIADNDENMVIVRGEPRVADIYLTEFNRLFNHYYFRTVTAQTRRRGQSGSNDAASLFLDETPGWQTKYKPGSLRAKRLALYTTMTGSRTL